MQLEKIYTRCYVLKATTTLCGDKAGGERELNLRPQLVFVSTRRQTSVVCDRAEEVKVEVDTTHARGCQKSCADWTFGALSSFLSCLFVCFLFVCLF